MKKSVLTSVVFLLMALLGATRAGAKDGYGILVFDESDIYKLNSLVSFPLEGGFTACNQQVAFGTHDILTGAYAEGSYYAVSSTTNSAGATVPYQLLRADIESSSYETVGTLTGFANAINDMSYDYAARTLWAVARNSSNSASELFSIDIATAQVQKAADLDRRFFTLACTYNGQLYGISFAGELCTIDKSTGAVAVVAQLAYSPNYSQTMEFDHTDGTLYWAAQVTTVSGAMELDECFMATIDVATGEVTRMGAIGDSGQITGLYIPFQASADGTPGFVTGLTVTPAAEGAPAATLKWKNPTETFDGAALAAISGVEVWRGDVLAGTVTDAVPGDECSFTDHIGEGFVGGTVTYRVVAKNEVGDGAAVERSAFVGTDVPAAPASVTLTGEGTATAVITWTASTTGLDGGYVDASSVRYNVTRSDGLEVARLTQELSAIDADIAAPGGYSYTVAAVGTAGEGGSVTTEEKTFGPANSFPYTCSFDDDAAAGSWRAVDADGDGNAWSRMACPVIGGRQAMAYLPASTAAGEDYVTSYPFHFEQGHTYQATVTVITYGTGSFDFVLLAGDEPVQTVQTYTEQSTNWSTADFTFTFTPETTGAYGFAMKSASAAGSSWLWLTQVDLVELLSTNLMASAVTGDEKPAVGTSSLYTVTVRNAGSTGVDAYTVNLLDAANGTVLASQTVSESLEAGASRPTALNWTPADRSVTAVAGEVVCDGDANAADNLTAPFAVEVQEAGAATTVRIGTDYTGTTNLAPFDTYDSNSAVLNLYAQSEIGKTSAWITAIAYEGTSYYDRTFPVKVYMANTDLTDTNGGWIAESDMTLVYEGDANAAGGFTPTYTAQVFTMELPLDTPFPYTGGNLAVLTTVSLGTTYYSGISFRKYQSPLEGNGCRVWYGSGDFDFSSLIGVQDFNSSIALTMQDEISGIGQTRLSGGSSLSLSFDGGTLTAGHDCKALRVTDMGGRTVAAADGNSVGVAPLRGVYVVTATMTDGTVKTAKVSL